MSFATEILALAREVTYSHTASTTWIIYDAVTNLDVEVEFIWQRRNSQAKWLYLCTRYVPIFHGIAMLIFLDGDIRWSRHACRVWVAEQIIAVQAISLLVDYILMMRLYALYDKNKVILMILLVSYGATIMMKTAATVIVLPRSIILPDSCLAIHIPGFFMCFSLSSLAFETFLFGLTLVQFCRSIQVLQHLMPRSILFILVRDGSWAFAMLVVVDLFNTILYSVVKTPLAGIIFTWMLPVISFAGSHVILNLRLFGNERSIKAVSPPIPTLVVGVSNSEEPNLEIALACVRMTGVELDARTDGLAGVPHDSDGAIDLQEPRVGVARDHM